MEQNTSPNLEGKILIGTPTLDGSVFDRALVYILGHDHQGSLGVVFNKPLFKVGDKQLADEMKAASPLFLQKSYDVFAGGPVEDNKTFVLTYTHVQGIEENAAQPLSLFLNVHKFFQDLLSGEIKAPFLITKGYCSWAPNQLDAELNENSWFVLDTDYKFIFEGDPATKWEEAIKKAGINDIQALKSLVSYTGHA